MVSTIQNRSDDGFDGLEKSIKTTSSRFIPRFLRWSWIILILFSVAQCLVFFTTPNIFAVFCVVLAWFITTKIFLSTNVVNDFPITTLLVLGFTVTQFYFPLVFTLVEFKPLVFNMDLPFEVFIHSIAALLVLVISHAIYREFFKSWNKGIKRVLFKARFFQPVPEIQLWLMGLIGLCSMVYVYIVQHSVSENVTGTALDKAIQGLLPFTYAPYFIFVSRMYGGEDANKRGLVIKFLPFTLILFLVSIGSNVRSAFMLGFTSLGFAFILSLLLGIYKTRLLTIRNVMLAVVALYLFTGPIADLGTAMVIVRNQKGDISKSKLISLTLDAYNNKKAIETKRIETKKAMINNEGSGWDEYYLDNIFLNKFCNLKFNDASLVQAAKLGPKDKTLYKYTIDRIWTTLPDPVLNFLQVKVDKKTVNFSSFGDFLFYRGGAANSDVLGGHRSGSLAGTSMAAFGLWYLLFLGIGIIPVFVLVDSFFIKVYDDSKQRTFSYNFSLCGLLALTSFFEFLPAESVIVTVVFIIRGFLQMIFLYYVVFQLTRVLSGFFKFD